MKKYSLLFLILAIVTGFSGFMLGDFAGIEVLRVLFIIFVDLLVITILARALFHKGTARLKPIKIKKNQEENKIA